TLIAWRGEEAAEWIAYRRADASRPHWAVSLPQQVAHHEPDVRRALGQAAHQIRIPGVPEWNVHTHAMPRGHVSALQIAANAIEHLNLIRVFRDAMRRREINRRPQQSFVMCGQSGIIAGFKKHA